MIGVCGEADFSPGSLGCRQIDAVARYNKIQRFAGDYSGTAGKCFFPWIPLHARKFNPALQHMAIGRDHLRVLLHSVQ